MTNTQNDAARQQVSEIKAKLEVLKLALINEAHTIAMNGSGNVSDLNRRRDLIEALEYAIAKAPAAQVRTASVSF